MIGACRKEHQPPPEQLPNLQDEGPDVAAKWADMSLFVIRYSAFNTPTYSSRSLAYLGLCMYETIVSGHLPGAIT
jgi:hypothetical protein